MTWFDFALMTAREDLDEVIQCFPPINNNIYDDDNNDNISSTKNNII